MAALTIKQQAVARAVNFLNSVGAHYLIRLDGEVVADTLPQTVKAKKPRVQKNHFSRDIGYIAQMVKMQPGDTVTWCRRDHACLLEKSDWVSFTSSVGSEAARRFTRDKFLTEKDEERITLLRVE